MSVAMTSMITGATGGMYLAWKAYKKMGMMVDDERKFSDNFFVSSYYAASQVCPDYKEKVEHIASAVFEHGGKIMKNLTDGILVVKSAKAAKVLAQIGAKVGMMFGGGGDDGGGATDKLISDLIDKLIEVMVSELTQRMVAYFDQKYASMLTTQVRDCGLVCE